MDYTLVGWCKLGKREVKVGCKVEEFGYTHYSRKVGVMDFDMSILLYIFTENIFIINTCTEFIKSYATSRISQSLRRVERHYP